MSVGRNLGRNITMLIFACAAAKLAGLNNGLEVAENPQSPSYTPTTLSSEQIGDLSFVEAASAPVTGASSPVLYNSFAPE